MDPLPSARHIVRHRDRLACTNCRRRKVRCDKNSPCIVCTRRGDEASCTYQHGSEAWEQERDRRVQAETRLERLERIIQQLAAQNQHQQQETTPPVSADDSSSGSQWGLSVPGTDRTPQMADDAVLNGSTHWTVMLKDIQALRSTMTEDEINYAEDGNGDEPDEGSGIGPLFGSTSSRMPSLEEVLNKYLPGRQEVDRLVSAYFQARSVAAPFIHSAQFRRQYQAFWADPANSPPLWISMLFSICFVASNVLRRVHDLQAPGQTFATASAECLIIGEYYRPKAFAVEALLLYAHSQCLTQLELPQDLAPLFGLIVRLAVMKGYHQDFSDSLTRFSVFEQEMRRRTWSMVLQLDLLTSFHFGFPSSVQSCIATQKLPSSLLDTDFDEDTTQLPIAKLNPQSTDIFMYIIKHRFMLIFERVLRHTLSAQAAADGDIEQVNRLDAELREVYESLPSIVHARLMSESVVDSTALVVTRLCVSFMYNKSLCVLHRPYVTRGRPESIRACYVAARALVTDFVEAYPEFMPGGQRDAERWLMSSLSWHEFLLGASALALVMCAVLHRYGHDAAAAVAAVDMAEGAVLLARARDLCAEQAARRRGNTARVKTLLAAVLARLEGSRAGTQQSSFGNGVGEGTAFVPYRVSTDGVGLIATSQDSVQQPLWADADLTWAPGLTGSIDSTSWDYLSRYVDLGMDSQDILLPS